MLGLVALALTAASAGATPSLTSNAPWWERVVYTIDDEGGQQSCRYESSFDGSARSCDDVGATGEAPPAAATSAGSYAKITIERRFTPGGDPDRGALHAGDTLLGGQVMALSFNSDGTVRGCRVVSASGDVRPVYGCDEARAERFEASAARATEAEQEGYMTILVYGHEEYIA